MGQVIESLHDIIDLTEGKKTVDDTQVIQVETSGYFITVINKVHHIYVSYHLLVLDLLLNVEFLKYYRMRSFECLPGSHIKHFYFFNYC